MSMLHKGLEYLTARISFLKGEVRLINNKFVVLQLKEAITELEQAKKVFEGGQSSLKVEVTNEK